MVEPKRYRNVVADSARWTGFRYRAGDIVICTPPKSGTTWMQMLCAMLVHDTAEFDRPLSQISPWLDMQTAPVDAVLADLEAQEHRRIIKTHTPLDGIPLDPRATYVCVARDPRDVAISMEHHMSNIDLDAFMAVRASTVGLGDLAEIGRPTSPSTDPLERFWAWADGAADSPALTLASVLGLLQTVWDRRSGPNVTLFHYSRLLADLPAELRRLADALGIGTTDGRLAEFAGAATFDAMKSRADDLAPGREKGLWRDHREFFHRGRNGQWRDLLDDAGLRRYEQRVAQLVAPDLAAWAHEGVHPGAVAQPIPRADPPGGRVQGWTCSRPR